MGQVWAARLHGTRGFQKLVAVKTILPSTEDAGHLEAMLFEEASLAALIKHPNVVETLDLGEREDGTMYLVMEWVSGEPLDHILRVAQPVGGVPPLMIVHFVMQALCGLRAVHEASNPHGEQLGIVHRDVSPQNLLVTYDGVVKLIDFGIAKATQQLSLPTEEGLIKGKFAYMSPEQLRSELLDARADLFGAGVILYAATTGVHPFQGANLGATMRNILMSEPQKPSVLVPGYPRALEEVVLKALSKDRGRRFMSAEEMTHALEQAVPEVRLCGIEKQCGTFLRQLFADRIAERTRALQAAMKAADEAAGAKSGDLGLRFPRSQSTMRAVSREMVAGVSPADSERDETQGESGAIRRRARRGVVAFIGTAIGIGGLLAVGLVGSRALAPVEARSARGAATATESVSSAGAQGPALQSDPSSALLSSPSPSASVVVPIAPNQSRPVLAPKRRGPHLADAAAVPTATAVAQPPPPVAPAGAAVEVDPLSRRR
jgi:serine/threonine-protein kinase